MHFVDELSVQFLKVVETAAIAAARRGNDVYAVMGSGGYRANSVIMTSTEKQKTIQFIEDILIDSPGVIPVTIN